jgi:hypothetical protein
MAASQSVADRDVAQQQREEAGAKDHHQCVEHLRPRISISTNSAGTLHALRIKTPCEIHAVDIKNP